MNGREIEKKFLLARLPRGVAGGAKIRQGYLSTGEPEVRVRMKDASFFLTRKSGAGLVRDEQECGISKEAFEILWSLTENARIEKTRYEIAGADGLIWEIDEFHIDSAKQHFIAEVELPDELIAPQIPLELAEVIVREVTAEAAYKNKNLAVKGFPVEE